LRPALDDLLFGARRIVAASDQTCHKQPQRPGPRLSPVRHERLPKCGSRESQQPTRNLSRFALLADPSSKSVDVSRSTELLQVGFSVGTIITAFLLAACGFGRHRSSSLVLEPSLCQFELLPLVAAPSTGFKVGGGTDLPRKRCTPLAAHNGRAGWPVTTHSGAAKAHP
jgi:hypothetical protein